MPKKKQKAPGKSHREGIGVMELLDMFPNEESARKWFENLRWPDGERHCPKCGSVRTKTVPNENPMPYHCGDCRKYFSVKTGTVMEKSKLPLRKWVIAIYLMSTNLKGVSSMKLYRDLGVTQKTAWMMAQKIREGWIQDRKLSGTVEVDPTFRTKRFPFFPIFRFPRIISPAAVEQVRPSTVLPSFPTDRELPSERVRAHPCTPHQAHLPAALQSF